MMNSTPAKLAELIIDEYSLHSPAELDVEEIAYAEKLVVKESILKNFAGTINFNEKCGLITINSNILEPGQWKFTLAHEMGHFFNERNKLHHLRGCTTDDLNSYKSHKHNEDNANEFAAELLMYRPWFNDFIIKRDINFDLIKNIAEYFNVSLTAAAIRYANIGKHSAAVIYSKDGKVVWSTFHEHFPFKFIPNGYLVHKDSAAYDFFAGGTMQTCFDLVPAKVWFASDYKAREDVYLYEQNVAMPNYNAVLTMLWESEFV